MWSFRTGGLESEGDGISRSVIASVFLGPSVGVWRRIVCWWKKVDRGKKDFNAIMGSKWSNSDGVWGLGFRVSGFGSRD